MLCHFCTPAESFRGFAMRLVHNGALADRRHEPFVFRSWPPGEARPRHRSARNGRTLLEVLVPVLLDSRNGIVDFVRKRAIGVNRLRCTNPNPGATCESLGGEDQASWLCASSCLGLLSTIGPRSVRKRRHCRRSRQDFQSLDGFLDAKHPYPETILVGVFDKLRDTFRVSVTFLELVPKPEHIARVGWRSHTRTMELVANYVMHRDEAASSNKGRIQFEITLHSFVGVIGVNEEEVEPVISEETLDAIPSALTVGITPYDSNSLPGSGKSPLVEGCAPVSETAAAPRRDVYPDQEGIWRSDAGEEEESASASAAQLQDFAGRFARNQVEETCDFAWNLIRPQGEVDAKSPRAKLDFELESEADPRLRSPSNYEFFCNPPDQVRLKAKRKGSQNRLAQVTRLGGHGGFQGARNADSA